MGDGLVQTRLPPEVLEWVEKQAATEGESVAAWVRKNIMRAYGEISIEAWVVSERQADPRATHRGHSHYYLERIDENAYRTLFVLHHGKRMGRHAGALVSDDAWMQTDIYAAPDAHRLILAGSPYAWRLRSAHYNARLGRVELGLAPVREADGVSPKRAAALAVAHALQTVMSKFAMKTPSVYFIGRVNAIEYGDDLSVDAQLPKLVEEAAEVLPTAFADPAVSEELRRDVRSRLRPASPSAIGAASKLLADILGGDPETYAKTWSTVPA